MLLKSTPDAHSAVLDDSVHKRDRGELADHIARLANEQCKRSNTLLIAASIGAVVGLVLALLVAHWFGERGSLAQGEITPASITTRTATIFRSIVLTAWPSASHFTSFPPNTTRDSTS